MTDAMREAFEKVRDCSQMDFMDGQYYVRPYPEDTADIPAEDLNRDWELWKAAYANAQASAGGPRVPQRLMNLAMAEITDAAAEAQEGGTYAPAEWANIVSTLDVCPD